MTQPSLVQGALITDLPVQVLSTVLGPMERFGSIWITQNGFSSGELLRTLIGTVESRSEQLRFQDFGAAIIPFGTKPPKERNKYKKTIMLKERLDYGMPYDPMIYELRSPYQYHYARELEHPETVIIPPNEWYPEGLREIDIHNYYNAVSGRIVDQFVKYNVDGMVMSKIDHQLVVRRHASVEVRAMKLGDHEIFDRLNNGRTVEFHFALDETTRLLWLDLDPKQNFPWDETKQIAAELGDMLRELEDVDEVEIRFSGKSGFHVYGIMRAPIPTPDALKMAHDVAYTYLQRRGDDRLTTDITRDPDSMRIDYSTLHYAGGLRAAYSLAYPTGLVCLPLTMGQLVDFDKRLATWDQVAQARQASIRRRAADDFSDIRLQIIQLLSQWWKDPSKLSLHDLQIVQNFGALEGTFGFKKAIEKSLGYVDEIEWEEFGKKNKLTDLLILYPEQDRKLLLWWWNGPGLGKENIEQVRRILELSKVGFDEFKENLETLTGTMIEERTLGNKLSGLNYIIQHSHIDPYHTEFMIEAAQDLGIGYAYRYAQTMIESPFITYPSFVAWIEYLQRGGQGISLDVAANTLKQYQRKRKFDETSEPKGAVQPKHESTFVVQRHDAYEAGLHFDFRLAMHGVLKSWVIPKLPALLAGQQSRAQAIPVEDHPLEYAKFEGEIPRGLYGGGRVVIFEEGNFEITEQSKDAIKFIMNGKKLQGPFTLYRDQQDDNWYLTRGKQEHVDDASE